MRHHGAFCRAGADCDWRVAEGDGRKGSIRGSRIEACSHAIQMELSRCADCGKREKCKETWRCWFLENREKGRRLMGAAAADCAAGRRRVVSEFGLVE